MKRIIAKFLSCTLLCTMVVIPNYASNITSQITNAQNNLVEQKDNTYAVDVFDDQDTIDLLLEKLKVCKAILEDYEITQEQFEEALEEFETIKEQVKSIENSNDVLNDMISEIQTILEEREDVAWEDKKSQRAFLYVRLAEAYQKDTYIEKAKVYLDDMMASSFKGELVERLEKVIAAHNIGEEINE